MISRCADPSSVVDLGRLAWVAELGLEVYLACGLCLSGGVVISGVCCGSVRASRGTVDRREKRRQKTQGQELDSSE